MTPPDQKPVVSPLCRVRDAAGFFFGSTSMPIQFSIRSLMIVTTICAVLCWFAFRLVVPLWAYAVDAGSLLLTFAVLFGAGALLVHLKGSV